MTSSWLATLLARDLRALSRELNAYPDDASVWQKPDGLPNSAGTLALHLVGNLRHFVGAVLGGTGYVRDRDAEFRVRDLPRAQLLDAVEETIREIEPIVRGLSPEAWAAEYPIALGSVRVTTGDFLLHLATHLTWHLGQVDYHRRLLTSATTSVGAVAPSELATARIVG